MSEKKYKITTKNHQFFSDWCGSEYLKQDNQKFFAREKPTDNWEELKILEKQTSALERWDDMKSSIGWGSWILLYIIMIIFPDSLDKWVRGLIGISLALWFLPCLLVDSLVSKFLKDSQSYFVEMSDLKIQKLIDHNKPYTPSKNYTNSSSYSRRSYNSGGGGGGSSGSSNKSSYEPPLVSNTEMNNMFKELDTEGKDWNTLANKTTIDEREKLFSKHLGSDKKGKYANEKFEREELSSSRKGTLKNNIKSGDFLDESIRESLQEKVDLFDGVMSNDDFQKIFSEIRVFEEQKRKVDVHTKYEGRLSNKDIKAIKEHLGYVCMACGLDPEKQYGKDMIDIIEAHHKIPYAELSEGETRTVEPDDFLMLCPTCHRMIHRLDDPSDLKGLKDILTSNKK